MARVRVRNPSVIGVPIRVSLGEQIANESSQKSNSDRSFADLGLATLGQTEDGGRKTEVNTADPLLPLRGLQGTEENAQRALA
jgi:hypothetical protein